MADFEWDPAKEVRNARRHGVTFSEASTVFNDPLARTLADNVHSIGEERLIRLGVSPQVACYSWYIRNAALKHESSAPDWRPGANEIIMKKTRTDDDDDEMMPEYDFSQTPRGRYAGFALGSKAVVLEPDVAEVFKDSEAVNKALRGVIKERKKARASRKRAS